MHDLKKDLAKALATMGYDSPREGQVPLLEAVMYNNDDIIGVMPTGGGKSATFVLPTLAKDWRCLVISPLIALQNDQVDKLVARKVSAAAINSGKAEDYIAFASDGWSAGLLQFLYVAPERLETNGFRLLMAARRPDLIVVDEVHTAAMWGDDFRPAYHKIGTVIDQLRPVRVLCLTATMTDENEADVRRILRLEKAVKLTYFERRDNLHFLTLPGNDQDTLRMQLDRCAGSAIVYATTVKRIEEELFPELCAKYGAAGGIVKYHGQMEHNERILAQKLFMDGKARIVVATNAFGLGVDKPDIRMILHADLPGSIEAYIQEAGRAGRDGKPAVCAIGYDRRSVSTQLFFAMCRNPDRPTMERVWTYLVRTASRSGGAISKTVETMAREAGVMEPLMATCINIMKAAGMIDREVAGPAYVIRMAKVQPVIEDAELAELRDKLIRLGDMDRVIKVKPQSLANILKCEIKELEPALKGLRFQSVLDFDPPSRGKRTRIRNDADLGQIDWVRLARKAKREAKQLSEMVLFASIPDERKHDAAEAYFRRGHIPRDMRPSSLLNDISVLGADPDDDDDSDEPHDGPDALSTAENPLAD